MYQKLENTIRKKWIGDIVANGTWTQLCVEDNEICLKKSESEYANVALGPIMSISRTTGDPVGPCMAEIDCSPGLKRTSVFDTSKRYDVNANLFVVNGILTTAKEEAKAAMQDGIEPFSIGIVVEPPSAILGFLTYYRYS